MYCRNSMKISSKEKYSFPFELYERIEIVANELILQKRTISFTKARRRGYLEKDVAQKFTKNLMSHSEDIDLLDICHTHNLKEYKNVLANQDKAVNFFLNDDGIFKTKIEYYFYDVKSRFTKWFMENGFSHPTNIDNDETTQIELEKNELIRRPPKYRELKEMCEEIAEKIGLKENSTLREYKILKVYELISAKGINTSKDSVGSVLRKLGYRIKKRHY